MQLSNNSLVKQTTTTAGEKRKIVVTKAVSHVHSSPIAVDELSPDNPAYKLRQKDFETLRQKVIATAQAEAAKIKEKAYQAGEQEGYAKGYQDGKLQGELLATKLEQEAQQNLANSILTAKKYISAKKNEIVAFAVEMAEAIVQHRLDEKPAEILSLLEPILFKLEKPDQIITIRAHEKYHELLAAKMEEKKKEFLNLRYIILNDKQMSPYEVTVESNESFETLVLQEELHKFLVRLGEKE
ncbi:FliH/SctL family protein [Liquorilactobacillus satsumensis]|uniref:Flagellar assembly protein FliH n=1 Tax=Liquorilactobacillus satsumensis TaxID=259059 RepID=A0A0A7RGF0_9LACO|nr:FliH/SctL family protein [Liquorilactobacillus satsumensis]AJA34316.1 flagellar assembly protein FliH [Liquorilactobacillus satsumensis]MCP9312877.1 flagellar assembly protein FliH [Liquorilactobacillus satsumensis]MCP9357847.1 flagellar assembly protein FliH [Liquorilactobacillus satsumensis]MCP9359973.1 flagellar assembly protein FliH [Liquorilactobacillus satsumensis]MCP9371587.1 flagellar assembly protein FliH [Liquorilactobacillus satsumensis]